jgi:hypothetical protein
MGDPRAAKQYEIIVDGEMCRPSAVKTGGSTWTVRGTFRGRPIEGKGPTESQALTNWRKRANHIANE